MIVHPIWIYLIGVSDGIKTMATFILAGVILITVVYVTASIIENCDIDMKFLKTMVISCVLSTLVLTFTPSESTCYKMLAASLLTTDNLTAAKDAGKEVVDYIIDIANQLLKEDDNEENK